MQRAEPVSHPESDTGRMATFLWGAARPSASESGGESPGRAAEQEGSRLGTSARTAWVLLPRPKTQRGSVLCLSPTKGNMRASERRHHTVPGSRRANGWHAPGACSLEPNGRRLEEPNLPAAARPLLPLHRAPPRPFRRAHSRAPHRGPGLGTRHLPAARFASSSCEESHPSGSTPRPWTRATALPAWSPTRMLFTGQLACHSTEEEMMVG